MICPNIRAAQIYFKDRAESAIQRVLSRLLADARIDHIMWRAELLDDDEGYCVAAVGKGMVRFWPADGAGTAVDQHGNRWHWSGELSVVDGQVNDDVLSFPTYPNAFERIKGILDSPHSGDLWLSAGPGYEFNMPEVALHFGGGSHGSLHRLDSIVPLFVAGAPSSVTLPDHPRIIDIVPICLAILGLDE